MIQGMHDADGTGDPTIYQRNFSVSTSERVRALVGGPPAYMLRRRRIEDLEAWIIGAIRAWEDKTQARLDPDAVPAVLKRAIVSLRKLVEAHNEYYPIEANLPIDPKTGELVELGKRWLPKPVPTLDDLVARAHDTSSG
jgi:hypothetical protein